MITVEERRQKTAWITVMVPKTKSWGLARITAWMKLRTTRRIYWICWRKCIRWKWDFVDMCTQIKIRGCTEPWVAKLRILEICGWQRVGGKRLQYKGSIRLYNFSFYEVMLISQVFHNAKINFPLTWRQFVIQYKFLHISDINSGYVRST